MDVKGAAGEIKKILDIVDVMSYYGVRFTPGDGPTRQAFCFRHSEKVPSLSISKVKGLFHCFSTGCDAGGDIISFYQQNFNVDVYDAISALSEEFGVDITDFSKRSEAQTQQGRLYKVVNTVVDAFAQRLKNDKQVNDYLLSRGVSHDARDEFRIGYCPSVSAALSVAHKAGATKEDIRSLGLDQSLQHTDAIIFPIYTGGRCALYYSKPKYAGGSEGPKYVGPGSQHPLRRPGMLFGYQLGRREVRQAGGLVLVEGFFDVLTLHSKGIKNVVGMLGSSPKPEQFEIFRETHVPQVTVLFDADRAGEVGAIQAIKARKGDTKLKVAFLPEGDPDEYVLKHGEKALRCILEQSISAVDYVVGGLASKIGEGDVGDRAGSLSELAEIASYLPKAESLLFYGEMSKLTGISIEDLKDISAIKEDPKSADSESMVLAGCLKDGLLLAQAESKFRGRQVWMSSKHGHIWDAILKLKKQKISEFTPDLIRETVKGVHLNGELDAIFGREYQNFEYHLDIVGESFLRRSIGKHASRLLRESKEHNKPVSDVLSEHLSGLAADAAGDGVKEFAADKQVESAMEYVHERMEQRDSMPGIDLGPRWRSLTQITMGWQAGYMYLISALPKVGKTNLTLNWCWQTVIEQKIPGLWLNFEMSERDLSLRLLSMMSGVSNSRLRMGAIGAKDKELIDAQAEKYYAAPFHLVNAAGMAIQEVINVMRKYVYGQGVKIVYLDYIQLIRHHNHKLAYWERHADISTELKSAITTLGIPLVGVSQLSRAAIDGGGAAQMGGSFKYLQDCDVAMAVRRKSKEEVTSEESGNLIIDVEYNRHGASETYVGVNFDTETLRCEEV